jgi:hypothetical protein
MGIWSIARPLSTQDSTGTDKCVNVSLSWAGFETTVSRRQYSPYCDRLHLSFVFPFVSVLRLCPSVSVVHYWQPVCLWLLQSSIIHQSHKPKLLSSFHRKQSCWCRMNCLSTNWCKWRSCGEYWNAIFGIVFAKCYCRAVSQNVTVLSLLKQETVIGEWSKLHAEECHWIL